MAALRRRPCWPYVERVVLLRGKPLDRQSLVRVAVALAGDTQPKSEGKKPSSAFKVVAFFTDSDKTQHRDS